MEVQPLLWSTRTLRLLLMSREGCEGVVCVCVWGGGGIGGYWGVAMLGKSVLGWR
jgi:hypothetical protein